MAKVAIVTDSTAGLPSETADKYGVHVIPTKVSFGKRSFYDGVDSAPESFYPMLKEADALPMTSQPSAGEFLDFYRNLSPRFDAILSIHVSTALSGTVNSAHDARTMFRTIPVHIIDSRSISMGLGLMALAAGRAAAAGSDLDGLAELVEALIPKTEVIFVVETLEYLHKGGRVGGLAALLRLALRIGPILHLKDGRVEMLEKIRTKGKAKRRMLQIVERSAGHASAIHAAVVHAAAPDEAVEVAAELRARLNCVELHVAQISPVVGMHTGPGMVGIGFYCED